MGTTVIMLNKFRPKGISLMDPVTGEMISVIAMEPNTSIDPERIFIVEEWSPGDGKDNKGHFSGRLMPTGLLRDTEELIKQKEKLLRVIDNGTFGPCPSCGAKILTRIGNEFVCNAVVGKEGERCQFRTPLQKWTKP